MRPATIVGILLLVAGFGLVFGTFYYINQDITDNQNRIMSESFHREARLIEELDNKDLSGMSDAELDMHYRLRDSLEKRAEYKDKNFRARQAARKNGWTPMDGPPPPLPAEPATPAPPPATSFELSTSTLVAILGLLITFVIGALAAAVYFLMGKKPEEVVADGEISYVDHGPHDPSASV